TNIGGLYAFGEVNFAYHGATRLGANALLSCIFDGLFCGVSVVNRVREGLDGLSPAETLHQSIYDEPVRREKERADTLLQAAGAGATADPATNPYQIARELGEEMTAACTVVKTGDRLEKCLNRVGE